MADKDDLIRRLRASATNTWQEQIRYSHEAADALDKLRAEHGVPRDPTPEMIEAGSAIFLRQGEAFAVFARDVADAWQAMWDAAVAAPGRPKVTTSEQLVESLTTAEVCEMYQRQIDQVGVSTVQADDAQTPELATYAAESPLERAYARLAWAIRNVSGKAWRDAGIEYGEPWDIPELIDEARLRESAASTERRQDEPKAVVGHAVPREPSDAMLRAGRQMIYGPSADSPPSATEVWQAMYDAAVVPANPRPDPAKFLIATWDEQKRRDSAPDTSVQASSGQTSGPATHATEGK